MRELTELRTELDTIDRELVALYERRMAVAGEVAAYKMAHDLPVLDASREQQVIASRQGYLREQRYAGDIARLFELLMERSRAEQQRVMEEKTDA